MSYEKVSYISIKKDGRVFITSASNNVSPATYQRWEFMQNENDTTAKLKRLAKDIFNGNFQPNKACKQYELAREMWNFSRRIGFDVLGNDFRYKTNTYEQLTEYVVEHIGLPYFINGTLPCKTIAKKHEEAQALAAKFTEQYEQAQQKMDENGIISICSAIMIGSNEDGFMDYDALIAYDGRVIVAPRNNYSAGVLVNTDNSAIVISTDTDDFYNIGYRPLAEVFAKYPQIAALA